MLHETKDERGTKGCIGGLVGLNVVDHSLCKRGVKYRRILLLLLCRTVATLN